MNFLRYVVCVATALFAIAYSGNVFADPAPGSACTVANASNISNVSGIVYQMTCQSSVWVVTMTYRTDSKVGIGTTAPTANLEVSGTAASAWIAQFSQPGAQDAFVNISAPSNRQAVLAFESATSSLYEMGKQNNNTFYMWDQANGRDFLRVNAAGSLLLAPSAGNVGIGTTAPASLLEVAGTVSIKTAGAYLDYRPNNAACTTGQILAWDNTNFRWGCASDGGGSSVANDTDALSALTVDFTSTTMIQATATAAACGTLNVTNTSPGGQYTLTIPNANATCTTIQWDGSGTGVKLPAGYGGGVPVTGLVYTFVDDGTSLWITSVLY